MRTKEFLDYLKSIGFKLEEGDGVVDPEICQVLTRDATIRFSLNYLGNVRYYHAGLVGQIHYTYQYKNYPTDKSEIDTIVDHLASMLKG